MSQSSRLLIVGLSLLVLAGCDTFKVYEGAQPTESPSDVDTSSGVTNPYQIGKTWDRVAFEPKLHHPYQVLIMNRTGLGDVGVGVYLGVAGGRHIVMTAAHVFPSIADCTYDVSFGIESSHAFNYFPCGGWSYTLTENDIMFFEVNPSANVDLLVPLQISKRRVQKNLPLTLMSVQKNYETDTTDWHSDTSKECLVISDGIQFINDPDTKDTSGVQSWSVAMGCDGMHGDSGSPVLDIESKLIGLLWTGKFPKDEGSRDINTNDSFKIWNNFNYFVPVEKIKAELLATRYNKSLNPSDKVTLDQILTAFF